MEEKWGLVLSGGGAKGAYQIGVWQAMQECGMCDWVAGISGASIGALNAILFAGGNLEQAKKAWKQVNLLTVFDTEWSKIDSVLTVMADYVIMYQLSLYMRKDIEK